jgi:hypothetical protein
MYDWLRHMRKVRRWTPGHPEVIGLRGAEMVRARPSDLGIIPKPKPAEQEEEEE